MDAVAKNLAMMIAEKSFELWERKDFRSLVNFAAIGKTEQDRIFNELEVTGLGFIKFHLDNQRLRADDEAKDFFLSEIQKRIPQQFLAKMTEMGVEQKFVKIWDKLIKLRFDEYEEDLKLAHLQSANREEVKGDKKWFQPIWASIETMAICGLQHIRRGKTTPKDPLWKMLRKWLLEMEKDLTMLFANLDKSMSPPLRH